MVYKRLLLDPDPAPSPGGGGVTPPPPTPAPSPAIPAAEPVSRSTFPSASAALGLEEPPGQSLGAVFDQNKRNLPPSTAGLPVTPPAAPTPTPAPVSPPAPAPHPAPPSAPPAPVPERKVKIGDKEYTEAELAEIVKKQQDVPQPAQPPVPQPAAPPAPEPPKGPTPEEVAKAESDWVAARAKDFNIPISEEQVEQVLAGGKEGAEAFKGLLSTVYAKAVLEARKSIFSDLQQDFEGIQTIAQAVGQLVQRDQELQRYTTEQMFVQHYPEFKDNLNIARQVGEALVKQYPAEVQKMGQEAFLKLVAENTEKYLITHTKQILPDFKYGTWKEFWQSKQAPAPTTPPAAPAPAPVPVPTPPVPPVRPPVANAPTAPVFAGFTKDQHKTIAQSLRD